MRERVRSALLDKSEKNIDSALKLVERARGTLLEKENLEVLSRELYLKEQ